MSDLVSIIVPCYKVQEYLGKCVDSLLQQTYCNIEIFLVDDGSPDSCGEICDEYARKDNRIKVIHKENGGLSDARNVAIDVATGEWIVFVDSDDYVSSDHIETLYNLVKKYECLAGVSSYSCFFEDSQPMKKNTECYDFVSSSKEAIDRIFYQKDFETSAWGKIYHKSLFKSGIRYPKGWLYEDLPTTYRLFLECDKVAFVNKETYFYLLRTSSIEGSSFSPRKLNSVLQILDSITNNEILNKQNKESMKCRMISLCFHALLEMPKDYPDERKNILLDYIKQNKWSVFFDSKVRYKNKIAILLSILGIERMKMFLGLANKRK